MKRSAFSLVELSIVLVILGLLTGGILAGQSLIRAAELRTIPTQSQQYLTAVQTFRDKYFALPGDMTNATAFWGTAASCPGDETTPSTTIATCNGNGNGAVDVLTLSISAENFRLWQHMANAGLIEGRYTGVRNTSSGGNFDRSCLPGGNVPASKISSGGYAVEYLGTLNADTWRWNGTYNNALIFSKMDGINAPGDLPLLKPEEAWNIDTKMDDGKPASGRVMSYRKFGNAINCTTTNVESTTAYNLTDSSTACPLFFLNGF
ncbi:MAG: type II secretion system protein [Rickettsiales bacterium]